MVQALRGRGRRSPTLSGRDSVDHADHADHGGAINGSYPEGHGDGGLKWEEQQWKNGLRSYRKEPAAAQDSLCVCGAVRAHVMGQRSPG